MPSHCLRKGVFIFPNLFCLEGCLSSSTFTFSQSLTSPRILAMENRELGAGWPLGLSSLYVRLRLMESLPVHAAAEPRFLYVPSSSFSSLSSSTLDTESTVSFFQDNSKTLGRLIGIRPRNRKVASRKSVESFEHLQGSERTSRRFSEHPNQCNRDEQNSDMEMCHGFCVPICLMVKTNSNKDGSRRRQLV